MVDILLIISQTMIDNLLIISQVRATDRDVGINQELIFSLVNTSDFMIDPETREITTLRSFDYEQVQSFEVTILVRDNATDYRMSTSILRVDITDINDNTPYFVNFPVGQVVMVEENTTVGTLIQDIDAVDTDSSSNAQVIHYHGDCSIESVMYCGASYSLCTSWPMMRASL